MKVLLTYLGLLAKAQQCSSGIKDLTITPGSTGEDVARATFAKVWTEIATWDVKYADGGFFERYAYAESNYGLIQHHAVQQIWTIDEDQFNTTKTAALKNSISNKFNVDWDRLKYEELTIPTNSILALFLFIDQLNEFPIPYSIDEQDALYTRITHNTVDGFKDKVDELDQNTQNECTSKALDIVFVVDESGSVGPDNFDLVKQFLIDYAQDSNIAANATRIAIRTYSTYSDLDFSLNDFKTSNIIFEINNLVHESGGTNTADAITNGLNDFGNDRSESVKIMVTITDGQSNYDRVKAAADLLKADPRNIQSFAIGIDGANMAELQAIATTDPGHIEMLKNWSDFGPIKKNLQSKVCEGSVENNSGGNTQVGGSGGSPGKIILKIGMSGKDNFDFTANAPLTFFYHRSNPQPGPAVYDQIFNFTDADVNSNKTINNNIGYSHTFVYLSAYNYHPTNALVSLQINDGGASSPIVPDPVICPANSHCVGNSCECFPQYTMNTITGKCDYDNCAAVKCNNGYQCEPSTGACFCPEDYFEQDGNCYEAKCPDSAVQVIANFFGNAKGEVSSPWYENGVPYPNNFDCTYEFEAVRADDGCFSVSLDHPFGIEPTVDCKYDRLEIWDVVNADQVNMDHSGSRPVGSAVLCGDACVAEDGWKGYVCGDKLKIRFKSDDFMNDIGWRIQWEHHDKRSCPMMCNSP
ncbi:unnamed protein product [Oikopleura dioica]|uniref:VWFA domain-containing protein n=1 Tax=Oikopleura dioica TaxID=34765 RepID=E4XL76_OIKDI|nr:unnamed protein product [Oikopleura dioica]